MTRRRIAAVSYLNTIPFIYGIEHAGNDLHAGLLLSPPAGCAAALASGQADTALIPVAALSSIPELKIITDYCIGASTSVRTVVLACNEPLERLHTVFLDSHSLTSVRLVRIIARELWGIDPQWKEMTDFGVLDHPQEGTGYVIIGNKVFDQENRFAYTYDLADAWRILTGLPFVFAVWVARPEVSDAFVSTLGETLRYGLGHIPEAITTYGYGDKPYALDYLTRNIDFRFDSLKKEALELFLEKINPR